MSRANNERVPRAKKASLRGGATDAMRFDAGRLNVPRVLKSSAAESRRMNLRCIRSSCFGLSHR
jgi:hypothetical protein